MKANARERVLARDGRRCVNCESVERLNVHHVVPKADGGANVVANLVTLCGRWHTIHHEQGIGRLFYREEQYREIISINLERKALSGQCRSLKAEWHNLWNTPAYQLRKQDLDRRLKALEQREGVIRAQAATLYQRLS